VPVRTPYGNLDPLKRAYRLTSRRVCDRARWKQRYGPRRARSQFCRSPSRLPHRASAQRGESRGCSILTRQKPGSLSCSSAKCLAGSELRGGCTAEPSSWKGQSRRDHADIAGTVDDPNPANCSWRFRGMWTAPGDSHRLGCRYGTQTPQGPWSFFPWLGLAPCEYSTGANRSCSASKRVMSICANS